MDLCVNGKTLVVRQKNVNAEETPKYVLSKEQLDFYKKNGFLVIKGLINFECLYNVKKRFLQVVNGLEDKGLMTIVKEPGLTEKGAKGPDVINKINDIHFDEEFSSYSEDPRLLDVVAQLIGDSITVVHSMFINKPAGTARHPPHQDLWYFPFRPADMIVASWTAVDQVERDNGCLYVLPGSHRTHTLVEHHYPTDSNKFLFYGVRDESAAPEEQRVHLPMDPGDTVFFHPLLIHGSGPNVSKRSRKAITCHYASGECQYVTVDGTVQETVAKDIESLTKKIINTDVTFVRVKNGHRTVTGTIKYKIKAKDNYLGVGRDGLKRPCAL
ncbi:Phytanoyl-CoA dioxygenase, peroxisomal [Papilio machaon]|uniref:phytanoyl-CoA dioxygenase n=1 Tax=Papilio machaon TaxID=76193 RepID=A0A0N0PEX1_PAPMA|nr:Phytanoyl-CoA dioxygenase, peroxisomal [Papilio machaon]